MDSSEFETVDDEGAVKEVLRWLHQRYVWKVSGSDIIFHEELRYIVKKETIQQDPCWEARVELFDVWQQVSRELCFRLLKNT